MVDVRKTLTPQLHDLDESQLILLDLGAGANRLGFNSGAGLFADGQFGTRCDDANALLFYTIQN